MDVCVWANCNSINSFCYIQHRLLRFPAHSVVCLIAPLVGSVISEYFNPRRKHRRPPVIEDSDGFTRHQEKLNEVGGRSVIP